MGTTLTGTQINNTYDGLIKTTDNTAITATTKLISDGLGNDTCIKVGTLGTDFLGTVDFSAATVTGLPAGAAGLESGSGADSMQSAASLTTIAANAAQPDSIALGDGAQTPGTIGTGGIAIGTGTCVGNYEGVAIGLNAKAVTNGTVIGPSTCSVGNQSTSVGILACSNSQATAIGRQTNAAGSSSFAAGDDSDALGACSIAIGRLACTRAVPAAIAIGLNACAYNACDISIGNNSDACAASGIAIGNGAQVGLNQYHGIAIGCGTSVTGQFAGAIGSTSSATANGAYAIGQGVTAATADTVSVKALETQTASTPTAGGILMKDAGGVTSRRLNIDASGNLQIDSTPVGGGGAAGLVSGAGIDSMISDSSLTTLPATGAGNCSIALGNDAQASAQFDISIGHATRGTGQYGVSLGHTASTSGGFGIAIGCGAQAVSGGQNIAIGKNARACTLSQNIAIGENAVSSGNGGAISIGCGARQTGTLIGVAAIGKDAQVSSTGAQAFGWSASATAQNAVAIGCNLTASRADTTASCQFEAKQVGKGIVVTSPDGLTTLGIGIDNTGAIVTYTP